MVLVGLSLTRSIWTVKMLEILPILLATAALLGALVRTTRPLCVRQTWEEVAGWLRLNYRPARFGAGEVAGQLDGLPVRVRCYGVGALGLAGRGTCVVVDLRDQVPEHLVIRPLGVRMRLPGAQWWPAFATGDSCFDASISLSGDEIRCTALANHRIRAQLLEFVRRREWVALADGRLVCMVEGLLEAASLCQLVRRVLELSRLLTRSAADVPATLSDSAQRDSSCAVRRRSLELLVRDFASTAPTERALDACLHDPDPVIRGRAARELGPAGKEAHVRMLRDCAAPAAQRVAALDALATLAPRVELILHVERAIRSAEPALWATAAHIAAALELRECIPPLGRRAVVADDHTAAQIASALGDLGDRLAQPWLVQLLRREGRAGLAAARALGVVGTLQAIEPLLDLAHGLFRERALKFTARQSIEAVRARHGAEPARLSLVEPQRLRGALSLSAEQPAPALFDARRGDADGGRQRAA